MCIVQVVYSKPYLYTELHVSTTITVSFLVVAPNTCIFCTMLNLFALKPFNPNPVCIKHVLRPNVQLMEHVVYQATKRHSLRMKLDSPDFDKYNFIIILHEIIAQYYELLSLIYQKTHNIEECYYYEICFSTGAEIHFR